MGTPQDRISERIGKQQVSVPSLEVTAEIVDCLWLYPPEAPPPHRGGDGGCARKSDAGADGETDRGLAKRS